MYERIRSCVNISENYKKLSNFPFKGTLMQIWKSGNILVFVRKQYVEDFTLKHLPLFEIYSHEICGKFVYQNLETIEYVKN